MFLFATYRDGGILQPSTDTQCANGQLTNCTAKLQPIDNETGYLEDWRARIVADGDNAAHYLVPASALEAAADGSGRRTLNARERAKLDVVAGKSRRRRAARKA